MYIDCNDLPNQYSINIISNQSEPLFLKPDGVRTRYPIGWNGYGRYVPGTLRVTYNNLPCNVTEEPNGIFFNFSIPPESSSLYTYYTVSYVVRPVDYAFSTGSIEGGYPGEEYFLFPNWNNAKGEGDAFWIGKYQASNNGSNIPQSKPFSNLWNSITIANAINYSKSKGKGFGIVRNRQWVSIAQWTDHHSIHITGNRFGKQIDNLDGEYTTLDSCGGGYIGKDTYYFVTGNTVPDNWNHNGKSTGIHNMVGNIWEWNSGLENKAWEIYIFDDNNTNLIDSGVSTSNSANNPIIDIVNTSPDIFNEGITNSASTDGYIPSNLDGAYMWNNAGKMNVSMRGASMDDGLRCGIWALSVAVPRILPNWTVGFRLSRDIVDLEF